MEETQIEYDEEFLKEIQQWLEEDTPPDSALPSCWVNKSLKYCLRLIEQLRDENGSLWFMLDEFNKSQWTKEHSKLLEKTINDRLMTLKLMQLRKGEA